MYNELHPFRESLRIQEREPKGGALVVYICFYTFQVNGVFTIGGGVGWHWHTPKPQKIFKVSRKFHLIYHKLNCSYYHHLSRNFVSPASWLQLPHRIYLIVPSSVALCVQCSLIVPLWLTLVTRKASPMFLIYKFPYCSIPIGYTFVYHYSIY